MTERLDTRVALVGAGPVGLEVAARLAERGIEYLHFERDRIAASIERFPPGMRFLSPTRHLRIGDVPLECKEPRVATREEYLAYTRSIPGLLGLEVRTGHEVLGLKPVAGGFDLQVRGPHHDLDVHARKVVLVVGELARPRLLGIPGEDLSHVSHYFGGAGALAGRQVVIVGAGNSALEAAERCVEAGARVTLSYRRAQFRRSRRARRQDYLNATARQQLAVHRLARDGRIQLRFSTTPLAIEPGAIRLRSDDGREERLPAERVYLLTGYLPDLHLLTAAGGNAEEPISNSLTLESHVPGLYVAGPAASQSYRHRRFIYDAPDHARRILAHLLGEPAPPLARRPWQHRRRAKRYRSMRRLWSRLRRTGDQAGRFTRRRMRILKARLLGRL